MTFEEVATQFGDKVAGEKKEDIITSWKMRETEHVEV